MNTNQTGQQQPNLRDAVLQEHGQGGAGGGVSPTGKSSGNEIIRQVIGRGDASVDVGAVPTEGELP